MNFYIQREKQINSSKLRCLSEKNPKKYWTFLNSNKPKNAHDNTPDIDEFYEYFKSIKLNDLPDDDNYKIFNNDNEVPLDLNISLNAHITTDEILKCIDNHNNGKASNPIDEIRNEYIKSTKEMLCPLYTKLFNAVLDSGYNPRSWLEGVITPVFKKKGSPTEPCNYRPITILSCQGKLFTSVLNQRLTSYLEDNSILHENQAGFRRGYFTSDHLFTLHAIIGILRKRK